MSRTARVIVFFARLTPAVIVFFESGLYDSMTRSENMERFPPELDPLRAEILQQLHLEPIIEAEGDVGAKLRAKYVVVTYAFLPPDVDQKELEASTKTIVKKYIPTAESIRVQLKGAGARRH
jgi:hypothetical protein